ncbi:MAG: dTMP kinase [Syntrophobacterales bacterium]|nr:dTMP kinase [Syntrophobacterales bacterium]
MSKPRVISLEGIDGSGKSSLAEWLKSHLEGFGLNTVLLREPGSTKLGEVLREFLLQNFHEASYPWTDALLFYAVRVENLYRNIYPAIRSGRWVLLDRFQDATIAYQGYGQGLDIEKLEAIYNLITDGFTPDWTILLDCSPDVAWERLRNREHVRTRWEQKEFIELVREGYLELAKKYSNRITVVDGTRSMTEVRMSVEKLLLERLNGWGIRIPKEARTGPSQY